MERAAARLTAAALSFTGQNAGNWRHAMTSRIIALSAIRWVAIWVAPYIYAAQDLIAWH